MLLTTLALSAITSTAPLSESPQRTDRIEISPINTTTIQTEHLEGVPNPNNPESIVPAIVRKEFTSQAHGEWVASFPSSRVYLKGGMDRQPVNIDFAAVKPADFSGLQEAIEKVDVLSGSAGANQAAANINRSYENVLQYLSERRNSVFVDPPPQSLRLEMAGLDMYDFKVGIDYRITETTEYPTLNLDRERELDSGTIDYGTYRIPIDDMIEFQGSWEFTPESPIEESPIEQIGGIAFNPDLSSQLGTSYLTLPYMKFEPKLEVHTTYENYIGDFGRSYGLSYLNDLVGRSGYTIPQLGDMMQGAAPQGMSMNSMMFPGTPTFADTVECGSELYFPSGTLWVPDRPGYQVMSNFQPFNYKFPDFLRASGPVSFSMEQIEFRTHCLNMEKRQPATGVRYYPYFASDPVIRNLMIMANAALIRGPWQQAYTWIYTDKAPRDEINRLLVPAVSPARYLEGLYIVAMAGGFTAGDYTNTNLFDPAYLTASIARLEVLFWLTLVMAEFHAEATRRYLESAGNEVATALSGTDSVARTAIVAMIAMAIYSPSPVIRMGILILLDRLANGPSLIPNLPIPYYSLASDDSEEVAAAERVVERYSLR